jgi:hypothetical protein
VLTCWGLDSVLGGVGRGNRLKSVDREGVEEFVGYDAGGFV